MNLRRWGWCGAAILVGCAASMAACGGSGDTAGAGASSTSTTDVGPTTTGPGSGPGSTGPGSTTNTTTTTTTTTTTGTGGSGAGGSGAGGFVPMCIDSTDTILALKTLDFGDGSTNGWEGLGFDLDGVTSTATSTGLCTTPKPAKAYPDGTNGIDNSFGKNVIPELDMLTGQNVGAEANSGIAGGSFTLMIDIPGLTMDANQGPLTANIYGGGALGHQPAFDGTDCWPVTPESLSNPNDISTPTTQFAMVQVANNVVTTEIIPQMDLVFTTQAGAIGLTLHQARLSFTLSADHTQATVGQLGGVVDKDQFKAEVQKAIAGILQLICHDADSAIDDAADILDDATQDPSMACNGISVGLGFTLSQVKLGGIGPATAPSGATCN